MGQSATNTSMTNAINKAVNAIGSMPAPFVKYCSTIWNIEFSEDNEWD